MEIALRKRFLVGREVPLGVDRYENIMAQIADGCLRHEYNAGASQWQPVILATIADLNAIGATRARSIEKAPALTLTAVALLDEYRLTVTPFTLGNIKETKAEHLSSRCAGGGFEIVGE